MYANINPIRIKFVHTNVSFAVVFILCHLVLSLAHTASHLIRWRNSHDIECATKPHIHETLNVIVIQRRIEYGDIVPSFP